MATKAAQRARRIHLNALTRRKAAMNDPTRITAPLTPKTLATQERTAENQKFGPQESQIRAQIGVSQQQQGTIDAAYDLYRTRLQELRTSAANDQAAMVAQQQQRVAGSAAADTSTDPVAQQAAAARRALGDAGTTQLAARGGNSRDYLRTVQASGEGQRLVAHTNERRTEKSLRNDMTTVAAQRGDFRTTYNANARESERKYGLERQAFGLQQSKAQTDAKLKQAVQNSLNSDRRTKNQLAKGRLKETKAVDQHKETVDQHDTMLADKKYNLDVTKEGRAQAKDTYQRNHHIGPYAPPKGKAGKPVKNSAAAQKQINRIGGLTSTIHALQRRLGAKEKDPKQLNQDVVTFLTSTRGQKNPYGGYEQWEVDMAYDLIRHRKLSPSNRARLKRFGVAQIPPAWGPSPTNKIAVPGVH